MGEYGVYSGFVVDAGRRNETDRLLYGSNGCIYSGCVGSACLGIKKEEKA